MFSVRTELDFYPTCHVKSMRQIIAVKLEVFLNKLSHGLAWSVVHIRSFVWYCHLCSIKGHVSEVGFASVIRNNRESLNHFWLPVGPQDGFHICLWGWRLAQSNRMILIPLIYSSRQAEEICGSVCSLQSKRFCHVLLSLLSRYSWEFKQFLIRRCVFVTLFYVTNIVCHIK